MAPDSPPLHNNQPAVPAAPAPPDSTVARPLAEQPTSEPPGAQESMTATTQSTSSSDQPPQTTEQLAPSLQTSKPELDDFGLPIRPRSSATYPSTPDEQTPTTPSAPYHSLDHQHAPSTPEAPSHPDSANVEHVPEPSSHRSASPHTPERKKPHLDSDTPGSYRSKSSDEFHECDSNAASPASQREKPRPLPLAQPLPTSPLRHSIDKQRATSSSETSADKPSDEDQITPRKATTVSSPGTPPPADNSRGQESPRTPKDQVPKFDFERDRADSVATIRDRQSSLATVRGRQDSTATITNRERSDTLAKIVEAGPDGVSGGRVSEWSHQGLMAQDDELPVETEEDDWQAMPADGEYDLYDDEGRLIARGSAQSDAESDAGGGKGGAGRGYTRIQFDDDAGSQCSMDENTRYLFRDSGTNVVDEDEESRDPLTQMQATKDLLTEGQRIAYVGVTRLAMLDMITAMEGLEEGPGNSKSLIRELAYAADDAKKWGQKMMVRLYAHMDISPSEQIMIEQLAEHGVQPTDLVPALMINARVKNPMADLDTPAPTATSDKRASRAKDQLRSVDTSPTPSRPESPSQASEMSEPPPYNAEDAQQLTDVKNPDQIPSSQKIDIDLRWTVLCDLFLVLVADSIYDARSRTLCEAVGKAMQIDALDICRFEKRVTEALELQEEAAREDWDEGEHIETRRKRALKRRYMMMGLATVGGGLVIGLSAGLLAPVIGAGLAAGFTTIGVAGTGGFLAGAGGAALITSIGVTTGGTIAVRASSRRTGAVRTFEYRPLHNNKRVNLVVTVSGWMNGKVDDVRLPFSTVDPVMGDMYSVLWEPEMLHSMGDTIRILATEALTQGLQQILASTILTALMASLSLPIILTKLSYLVDNPWSVSCDRADAAGLILADSIIDRNLGARPITLVGFSLGARVICSCLRELARRSAFGLIANVFVFGSPVVAKRDDYMRARSLISGRFVNAYATNDWILGYLFRATSGGISRVAGLAAVPDIPGLENVNVTELVNGHMAYRTAMPRLLREVGWAVTSDEFAEIEDPDPEDHEARQRELIREIEDARQQASQQPEKRRFGIFKRGTLARKKGWETYDQKSGAEVAGGTDPAKSEKKLEPVLFDIDAIRKELESEFFEVRQLESTLPPITIETQAHKDDKAAAAVDAASNEASKRPTADGRTTKSFDDSTLPRHIRTTNGHAGYEEYDEGDAPENHDGVTMSFDLPDQNLRKASTATVQQSDFEPTTSTTLDSLPESPPEPAHSVRPALRTSYTLPLEKNAWADEEEMGEGWGRRDSEIKMTFE